MSVIIAISKALDIDISYEVFQVLYDGDDKVVAVAYKVNSEGYIVIDKENADIVEYNINTNHYFNFNEEEKILYGGPLSFFKENTNLTCIDVYGKIVEKEKISFETRSNLTNLNGMETLSSYPDEAYLNNSTATYNYNPDGRCGAVAAAIMLNYYDTYYNSGYIPSSLESSTGVTLIDRLTNNYLGTGTSYLTMASGLNSYFSDISMSATAVSKSAMFTDVWGKAVEYIYNNKPLVLLLQEAPTYGDHYVVATGYHEFYYNGRTRMYQVNDGWGSTQANVNDNYAAYITYLK